MYVTTGEQSVLATQHCKGHPTYVLLHCICTVPYVLHCILMLPYMHAHTRSCYTYYRLYVFTGMQSEEPIQTAGYICQFKNLEVKAVLLDEIMAAPESLERDWVLDMETKTLTDARELIAAGGLSAAYAAATALNNRYVCISL
jgi:hypothetical protein